MKILEMKEKRVTLMTSARAILDGAGDSLTAEQRTQYDAIMTEVDAIGDRIKAEERLQSIEYMMKTAPDDKRFAPQTNAIEKASDEQRTAAFRSFLVKGVSGMTGEEQRALQADVDASGGYTFAPEQFVSQLIKGIDNLVYIRQLATVIPVTSSDSLGIPTLATDLNDAEWTSEIATVPVDNAMTFGKRELKPQQLAKEVDVSMKLLRVSALPIEGIIAERLAHKFAVAEEKAFMLGNGTGQPLGVFVANASGIPAARDVSEGNTAADITADGLINALYSLKAGYRAGATWMMHRDTIKRVRKLKGTDGQYIWQPSITVAEPDTLLGRPVYESEYAPNTFTTGLYAAIVGDFRHYWIAENIGLQIQRLNELLARNSMVGFIGRMEIDAAPVLGEAFARVKLG